MEAHALWPFLAWFLFLGAPIALAARVTGVDAKPGNRAGSYLGLGITGCLAVTWLDAVPAGWNAFALCGTIFAVMTVVMFIGHTLPNMMERHISAVGGPESLPPPRYQQHVPAGETPAAPVPTLTFGQMGSMPQVHIPASPTTGTPMRGGARVAVTHITTNVLLHYQDAAHHETDRLVTIHGLTGVLDAGGRFVPDHIEAYCHTRKAARTFLVKNVTQAADAQTGEIIQDFIVWLGQLGSHG